MLSIAFFAFSRGLRGCLREAEEGTSRTIEYGLSGIVAALLLI